MRTFKHEEKNLSIKELRDLYVNDQLTVDHLGAFICGTKREFTEVLYCNNFREGNRTSSLVTARIVGVCNDPVGRIGGGLLLEFSEDIYGGHDGHTMAVTTSIPHNKKGCWWVF